MPKFGKPGTGQSGTRWKPGDHLGKLHGFANVEERPGTQTQFGLRDAVYCEHIFVFESNFVASDALVFGDALVGAIMSGLDGDVNVILGRIEQGTAKAGQNPPWLLADATDDDWQIAKEWCEKYTRDMPSGAIVVDYKALAAVADAANNEPF